MKKSSVESQSSYTIYVWCIVTILVNQYRAYDDWWLNKLLVYVIDPGGCFEDALIIVAPASRSQWMKGTWTKVRYPAKGEKQIIVEDITCFGFTIVLRGHWPFFSGLSDFSFAHALSGLARECPGTYRKRDIGYGAFTCIILWITTMYLPCIQSTTVTDLTTCNQS